MAARMRMRVAGMSCADCELRVTQALEGAGAREVEASFRRGQALFTAPAGVTAEALRAAVAAAGYAPLSVEPLEDGQALPAARPPHRRGRGGGRYDLAVVGSGGAAFAAAIRARDEGARVVMVERGTLGGTCVNVGCVPSKTLLRAADVRHLAAQHPFAGLGTQAGPVDVAALMAQKDELVARLRREKYEDLVADYGWELVRGEARFGDGGVLEVAGRRIRADAVLLATGASPAVPDIPGLAEAGYLTSTSVLSLERVPASVAVLGSGYVALELGQLLRRLGTEVTLLRRSPRLMPSFEPEVAAALEEALAGEGVRFLGGVRYLRVEGGAGGRRLHLEVDGQPRVLEVEAILVAAGRRPNTEALDLPRAGVEVGPAGQVLVDAEMRTSAPRVYAAGDVTLGPQFVYVAAYEGRVAAANALGGHERVDLTVVPAVVFTSPAVATVGMTEAAARAAGRAVRTAVLPLEAVPRALANRDVRGVVKLVAEEPGGRLLGAHVVAESAGEVIYAAALAVRFGLTVADLRDTLAPYLTMAEGLKLAAQTFERDVHRLSCCAG